MTTRGTFSVLCTSDLDIPQLRDNLIQSHTIVHFVQVLSYYSHKQQLKLFLARSWNWPNLIGVISM